jgi:hypothetical protein
MEAAFFVGFWTEGTFLWSLRLDDLRCEIFDIDKI